MTLPPSSLPKLGAPGTFLSGLSRLAQRHLDAARALAGNAEAGLRLLAPADLAAQARPSSLVGHLYEAAQRAMPGAVQGATSGISLRQIPTLTRNHPLLMRSPAGGLSLHQALKARDTATGLPFVGQLVDRAGAGSGSGSGVRAGDLPSLLTLGVRAVRDGARATDRPLSDLGGFVRQVVRPPEHLPPAQLSGIPRVRRRIRERSLQTLGPALGGGLLGTGYLGSHQSLQDEE